MAMLRNVAGAAAVLLVVLAMVLEAQAQCPSATSMVACQTAVTKMNTEPTMACCNKVKSVLDGANGAECLCTAMTSSAAVAFKVIKSEAVLLPSKCQKLMGLQYSKNYNCAGSNVP
jgi:hypothetical protein